VSERAENRFRELRRSPEAIGRIECCLSEKQVRQLTITYVVILLTHSNVQSQTVHNFLHRSRIQLDQTGHVGCQIEAEKHAGFCGEAGGEFRPRLPPVAVFVAQFDLYCADFGREIEGVRFGKEPTGLFVAFFSWLFNSCRLNLARNASN